MKKERERSKAKPPPKVDSGVEKRRRARNRSWCDAAQGKRQEGDTRPTAASRSALAPKAPKSITQPNGLVVAKERSGLKARKRVLVSLHAFGAGW